MKFRPILAFTAPSLLLLAACDSSSDPAATTAEASPTPAEPVASPAPAQEPAAQPAEWASIASGEGNALFIADAEGAQMLNLFCPSGSEQLVVTIADFTPDQGTNALEFGPEGAALSMATSPDLQEGRIGVTGGVDLPSDLERMLGQPIRVTYGGQSIGPFAPPSADLRRDFLAGCTD
jgi:hypothetical protein